jgi:hypothetical protein
MSMLTPARVEGYVRAAGVMTTGVVLVFVLWLFTTQPATIDEITGGVAASVGVYAVDAAQFEEGRQFFLRDQFPEARAAFARADPARRDARTQFYIAYTYYREGWGRLSHDDALYAEGLAAVRRAIAVAPGGRLVVEDTALTMTSADELRVELERGMRREWSDLNPFKVFRGRK